MVHELFGALPAPAVLAVSGITILLESGLLLGLVLPGATMALTLGLFTRLGHVALSEAIPVAIAGAIAGGHMAYLRGRNPGRAALTGRAMAHLGATRRSRVETAVTRAEGLVGRYGAWAILGGQWLVGLRTLTPRLAGRAGLRYRVFAWANVPMAAAWATTLVMLGHVLGQAAQTDISTASTVAGVAALVAIVATLAIRRKRRPGAMDAVAEVAWISAPRPAPDDAPGTTPDSNTAARPR